LRASYQALVADTTKCTAPIVCGLDHDALLLIEPAALRELLLVHELEQVQQPSLELAYHGSKVRDADPADAAGAARDAARGRARATADQKCPAAPNPKPPRGKGTTPNDAEATCTDAFEPAELRRDSMCKS
jgi:hypothetical protein